MISEEFPPLFQAGFHDIQFSDLENHFVRPFQETQRRIYLLSRFRELINFLAQFQISFEMWIDGSFSTNKENPKDIDIVFFFKDEELDNLSPDQQRSLMHIFLERKQTEIRYSCDVYYVLVSNNNMRSYWRGWFGFSRNEIPKGIPRLRYDSN